MFGKKREKLCNTAEGEQLQLPSKIKVTRHYLLYMKKKLFAQAKGIKTHCNAFYVNKNRAFMPVISLSLSYVVSDMI